MNGDTLEQQALKFIGEAETDRDYHKPWLTDVYRYCLPWRRRPGNHQQVNDQDDLFDATAIEALSDFAADMQITFTPIEDDWLDVEAAENLSVADAAQIAPQLAAYQDAVFGEIRRSNFHEASQEAYPDLGTGTCAMFVQDFDLTAPLQCQAVPITDLLIVRGCYGGVDFKAREIPAMKLRDLAPTYPRAALTPDLVQRAESDPGSTVCVHECYWRLWDRKSIERWQYVLLIDRKQADAAVLEGAGCCPLIVARWRTDSTTAWGVGPLYVVLPTIKTLDQLQYLVLKNLSFAVDPAGLFDDDGTINLENGVNPGDWIPRQVGSKADVLRSESDFDTTFFERSAMQSDIKRALFQDNPSQSGDTPPTASQWMDEKAEVARRMGAPFGRLTSEWQIALFQRFAYLGERRGDLPKVNLKGGAIRLRPQSPLVRAQRMQKVSTASQLLGAGNQLLGEQTMQVSVDGGATLRALQKALGDELVVLRSPEDQKALIAQAAQAAQAAGVIPQSPQQQGAPPPAVPTQQAA